MYDIERRATHDCPKPVVERHPDEEDVEVRFRCEQCGQRWRSWTFHSPRHGAVPSWKRVGRIAWRSGGWR